MEEYLNFIMLGTVDSAFMDNGLNPLVFLSVLIIGGMSIYRFLMKRGHEGQAPWMMLFIIANAALIYVFFTLKSADKSFLIESFLLPHTLIMWVAAYYVAGFVVVITEAVLQYV